MGQRHFQPRASKWGAGRKLGMLEEGFSLGFAFWSSLSSNWVSSAFLPDYGWCMVESSTSRHGRCTTSGRWTTLWKTRGQTLGILGRTIAEGKQKMESRTKLMQDKANCCHYLYTKMLCREHPDESREHSSNPHSCPQAISVALFFIKRRLWKMYSLAFTG